MELKIVDLGLIDFFSAWQIQKELLSKVKEGKISSALIFCQHHPVLTLGRSGNKNNILASPEELETKGISVYEVERGGDVTYHGPGQLTVYPIFNLMHLKKDIHWFLRYLEEVIIDCLKDFSIKGLRIKGATGVWVGEDKIASLGIAFKSWISFHGFSLNVNKDDLNNFRLIRPCGMDIGVTSVETYLGEVVELNKIKDNLTRRFKNGRSSLA